VTPSYIYILLNYIQSIQNLCSGFSYCITLLGYIYVWHGRGSLPIERKAALGYALGFGEGEEVLPQELLEGGEDQDEMFSMMLGNDDYAMADYWQWRATSKRTDPAIWRIQDDGGDQLVSFLYCLVLSILIFEGFPRGVHFDRRKRPVFNLPL